MPRRKGPFKIWLKIGKFRVWVSPHRGADAKIEALHVYETEGAWNPDTLLRALEMFVWQEGKQRVRVSMHPRYDKILKCATPYYFGKRFCGDYPVEQIDE